LDKVTRSEGVLLTAATVVYRNSVVFDHFYGNLFRKLVENSVSIIIVVSRLNQSENKRAEDEKGDCTGSSDV
jgi:hypothetical protein